MTAKRTEDRGKVLLFISDLGRKISTGPELTKGRQLWEASLGLLKTHSASSLMLFSELSN